MYSNLKTKLSKGELDILKRDEASPRTVWNFFYCILPPQYFTSIRQNYHRIDWSQDYISRNLPQQKCLQWWTKSEKVSVTLGSYRFYLWNWKHLFLISELKWLYDYICKCLTNTQTRILPLLFTFIYCYSLFFSWFRHK